ncbi:heterokaryon incompatibility protein-domain-containing protein [Chaetomium sp. MPI-CAGE-AT-0009]|nr:heterokaryon incompatibility protein-domain-containing protein [Chaetomium sp. MPI-CAGE-AT-0009]
MATVNVLHTFADISNGVLPGLVTRARKWRRNLRHDLRTWTPPFLRRNGPRYEHPPLVNCSRGTPKIRLLKLRRRWPLGPIRCELVTVDLHGDDLPDYEAISYHWGRAAFTEDIYLDGLPFRVAPIVQDLLYHLGSYRRDRLLWIDAICINQGDNAEKDVQIGLMRDVYRRAASVMVWLDGVEDPWMARRMLAGIWHEYVYGTTESCLEMVRVYSEPSAESGWMQLMNMFAHPWFSRVWVIQEIVLAKTAVVLASEQPLQFDHIATFARMLTSHPYNVVLQRSTGPGIRDDAIWGVGHAAIMATLTETRDDPRAGLALLLGTFANFRATEDRDRVYGLLGLLPADDADQPHLQPDSSKTVEALYMDVARHLIPTSPHETLSFAGIGYRRKLESLPSWAPDWTSLGQRDTHRQHFSSIQATAGFACGFGLGLRVAFSENTEHGAAVMQIQGHVLDEIHHMGLQMGYTAHNLGQGGSDEEMAGVLRSHVGNRRLVLRYARQPYPTGQPLDEVFWRSLIADTQFQRAAPATLGIGCRAWERIMHREAGLKLLPDDAEEDKDETYDALPTEEDMAVPNMAADPEFRLALEWNSARIMAATGRAMAVTKDGYVAVVPPKTEVGDLVCVFYGLNTPFLVRPQVNTNNEGGTRLVRLVGEAYVHGMMDGQAMMMADAQPDVFDVI